MTGPMNPPSITYFCSKCDKESEPWEDEPLGLCQYTGLPHGGFGNNPGPCDCGASAEWTCVSCDQTDEIKLARLRAIWLSVYDRFDRDDAYNVYMEAQFVFQEKLTR
jgi:hypothetical protein